jgi:hypothetical protein
MDAASPRVILNVDSYKSILFSIASSLATLTEADLHDLHALLLRHNCIGSDPSSSGSPLERTERLKMVARKITENGIKGKKIRNHRRPQI